MITTEPDRDQAVNLGDKFYRPIKIKVEHQQNFPRDIGDKVKKLSIELEQQDMLEELTSAIYSHITKSELIVGSEHTYTIELMILKPIKHGK